MTYSREELSPFLAELSLTGPIDPFFVFADWLLDRGDRWGELINFECRLEVEQDPLKLGELRAARWGRVSALAQEVCPHARPPIGIAWKRGFIRLISIDDAASPQWLGDELARILGAPMSALCPELSLAGSDLGEEHVQALLRVRDHLIRLPVLDLSYNWFSDATVAAFREVFPRARLTPQRTRDAQDGEIAAPFGNSWAGPSSDE